MSKVFNWGIMGPGNIAGRFMDGLIKTPDAKLAACASMTPGRAEAFSKKYGAPKWYDSYEALVNDPDIDAIYVATTNQKHLECALLAIKNKKPVLCEKPLTPNAKQAREMVNVARENKVFLMEAMWSRFFPLMSRLKEELWRIGDIKAIVGDFSYSMPGYSTSETEYRGFDPDCAGGALLDVGVYVLSFACMVLGKTPVNVSGLASMTPLGVDAHSIAVFGFDKGEIVSAYSGIDADTTSEATIYGSNGFIRIDHFWQADTMSIHTGDKVEKIVVPFDAPGFQYEILEVQRCVSQGLLESPTMPLDESIAMLEVLDKLRASWGLVYPCD